MIHDDLSTKKSPIVSFFSVSFILSPKLLLEYWGCPLKVFQVKITSYNFFVGTTNKRSIFHVDLTTKTTPISLIFPCILYSSPKLLLEYWGCPLKVFEAKITKFIFFMETKNKKSIFHVDFIEFNDKTEPCFLILSSILYFVPELLLRYWGSPLKVFQPKITICNFFVETKNKKSIFHVDLTSKLNPVFYSLLFLSYPSKVASGVLRAPTESI